MFCLFVVAPCHLLAGRNRNFIKGVKSPENDISQKLDYIKNILLNLEKKYPVCPVPCSHCKYEVQNMYIR